MNKSALADRLWVGLASGITTAITAGIVWILLASGPFHIVLPASLVWGSGIIGFIMGSVTLENYLISFLAKIWSFIYSVTKWW